MSTTDRKGYVQTYAPDHPLVRLRPIVAEHRMVLYDKLGPGEHPCHWCGVLVRWEDGTLTCDHLNHKPADNRRRNLVPSCKPCNDRRKRSRTYRTGESHPMAKLTASDVVAIRASTELQRVLAQRYGVSVRHIRKVRSGQYWHERPAECP